MATKATSTTDAEAAATAGVAVPPTSYSDYADVVTAQRAIDAGDPSTGWTVQSSRSLELPQDVPGQKFHPNQLPDPQIAIRAGMQPVAIPEYLVTEDEDDPQGPEPSEMLILDQRQAISERLVSDAEAAAKEAEARRAEDESRLSGDTPAVKADDTKTPAKTATAAKTA
jgi:hypothetical protein